MDEKLSEAEKTRSAIGYQRSARREAVSGRLSAFGQPVASP
jgi:hypothetical protein